MQLIKFTCLACLIALTAPASAAFVDDEFNGETLGPHWTWSPGNIPEGELSTATISVEGGHAILTAARGSDFTWDVNDEAYIEQDQPTEPEWSVETHITGFNPIDIGYQHKWNKAGLALIQDENHWIGLYINSDGAGAEIDWNGQSQFDPTADDGGNRYRDSLSAGNIGFSNDYYLRIRKTVDGYMGELSYDHVNWVSMTPLLRNPHTADGTLNGKIRLFTSTGAADITRNPSPVHFDYVQKTVLTSTVTPFDSDEFDGTSAAAWNNVLGEPAGSITFDGSAMVIDPKATSIDGGSDITQGTATAAESGVVAWQQAPLKSDFSIYTELGPTDFADASRWQGHGIRLWINQNCWVGIKISKTGVTPGSIESRNIVSAMFVNDDNTTRGADTAFTSADPSDPSPGFLRVDRADSQFRVQYSFDGATWVPCFTADYPTDGWITLNMQPDQPMLVQLFSYMPAAGGNYGSLDATRFEYVRELISADINDWQLY